MRAKGFLVPLLLLILTLPAGCDNVEWAGVDVELRPPPPAAGAEEPEVPDQEEAPLEPIVLGPLVYLVERGTAGQGRIIPVAARDADGYAALPDPGETPDLVERFPLERWEAGTRFVLFDQGVRAGTFTADGSATLDATWCLPRAVGAGTLELRPEAAARSRFLALRAADLPAEPSPLDPHPGVALNDPLRTASLDAARILITRLNVPWPTSIPDIRRRVDAFVDAEGRSAVAASFVFGDSLAVGSAPSTAYSLFLVTVEGEERWEPALSWYQRRDTGGKAFPGFLAAHDVRGEGSAELLVEVFGQDERSLALLELSGDRAALLYQDPCGTEPAANAIRAQP